MDSNRESEIERSMLAQLLENSLLYRSSKDYKALLDFVVRLGNFAPFNAMLLHIQKPGLMYAASAHDWHKLFDRTIKEGARPLLILWPFGPVALVYDVEDTTGPDLPVDVMQFFRAIGPMTSEKILGFKRHLNRVGVDLELIDYGGGLAGQIKLVYRALNDDERNKYQVALNNTQDSNVQFATLVHELGHLYLGHLGVDKKLKVPKRGSLTHRQRELEAESFSYVVCHRNGVQSTAENYLAGYVEKNTSIDDLDIYLLLRTAGQVEALLGLTPHIRFGDKN